MPKQESENSWIHAASKNFEQSSKTISFSTIVSGLAFAASVVYGAWALNQSQLANVNDTIKLLRQETQQKDMRLSEEISHREAEIKNSILNIQAELDRRRSEFANIKEFNEFKERALEDLHVLRSQLGILEQTRPTTGELAAISVYVKDQIARLEERVRQLEQNQIRRPGL